MIKFKVFTGDGIEGLDSINFGKALEEIEENINSWIENEWKPAEDFNIISINIATGISYMNPFLRAIVIYRKETKFLNSKEARLAAFSQKKGG